MKFITLIYGAVSDLVVRYLPNFNKDKNCFAIDNRMGGVLG